MTITVSHLKRAIIEAEADLPKSYFPARNALTVICKNPTALTILAEKLSKR